MAADDVQVLKGIIAKFAIYATVVNDPCKLPPWLSFESTSGLTANRALLDNASPQDLKIMLTRVGIPADSDAANAVLDAIRSHPLPQKCKREA